MLRPLVAVLTLLIAGPAVARGSTPPRARQPEKSNGNGRTHKEPAKPVKSWPAVQLEHLSTHESFVLRPELNGQLAGKRLRGLRHFLRCHHTGREHPIATRLAQVIYQTAHHFGDRCVTVVAGYRAPRVARAKGNVHSPHKRGVACDIIIHGVPNGELRDYLRSNYADAGVGYYPNAGFVHVDVGRGRRAFWIDYSGPGERARYSSDPDGDLVSGRAAPGGGGEAPDADEEEDEGQPTATFANRGEPEEAASSAHHRRVLNAARAGAPQEDDPGLSRRPAAPPAAPHGNLGDDDEPVPDSP